MAGMDEGRTGHLKDSSLRDLKTPCYVVDMDRFHENLNAFSEAFHRAWQGRVIFGYSMKTNHELCLLQQAKREQMYAEAVSADEYRLALKAGYAPEQMIYNGPQKTRETLTYALKKGGYVNLDNFSEIEYMEGGEVAAHDIKAKIGLRVNFDLESLCPGETTAGTQVSRFGFCLENGDLALAIERLHRLGIIVSGLHMHYSSVSRSKKIFQSLAQTAARVILDHSLEAEISFINMGGGFFYGKNIFAKGKPDLEDYTAAICPELLKAVSAEKCTLILEPGAALISSVAEYHTAVINERRIRDVRVLTVDGSNLHINPLCADRNASYTVVREKEQSARKFDGKQIVCGSSCMENDRMACLEAEEELSAGDRLVFHLAGAYTMGFNSSFINTPPYIYEKRGSSCRLVRDKEGTGTV